MDPLFSLKNAFVLKVKNNLIKQISDAIIANIHENQNIHSLQQRMLTLFFN